MVQAKENDAELNKLQCIHSDCMVQAKENDAEYERKLKELK